MIEKLYPFPHYATVTVNKLAVSDMGDRAKVFCVDDEKVILELLGELLEGFECQLFDSGQACLEAAAVEPPDIFLLDVRMPGIGGLETCSRLRKLPQLRDIPVIFLSGNVTLEDRLDGYNAGGDDYLTKPFECAELLAKVNAALKRKELTDAARQEAAQAASSVSDVMTAMGEMGTVVNFFQNTFNCRSYEALANRIIQAHTTLGLEVAIEFRVDGQKMHYSTTGVESPLEESVFAYVLSKGRLVNCGQRAAVNYPQVTIIIRNMPQHDEALLGRVRDYIAMIAQGADSKIKALRTEMRLRSQREELIGLVQRIEEAISAIEGEYLGQQRMSEGIFTQVLTVLEDSFLALGLSEQQEAYQRSIIETADEQSRDLYKAGLALDEHFAAIRQQLHTALAQCDTEQEEEAEEDAVVADAVELF